MNVYEITLEKGSQDAFAGIRLNEGEFFEFVGWNDNEEEVYSLETERSIDLELDQNGSVKSYLIWDGHGNPAL